MRISEDAGKGWVNTSYKGRLWREINPAIATVLGAQFPEFEKINLFCASTKCVTFTTQSKQSNSESIQLFQLACMFLGNSFISPSWTFLSLHKRSSGAWGSSLVKKAVAGTTTNHQGPSVIYQLDLGMMVHADHLSAGAGRQVDPSSSPAR